MDTFPYSDFRSLGEELMRDQEYLSVVERLKEEGKYRIIETDGSPYLERYYYLNLRPFARIVIHRFRKSDEDGLHDHPWAFQNFILDGGYWENTEEGRFWRAPGYMGSADANFRHRVELDFEKSGDDIWTLFMMGPKEKAWGFVDGQGQWVNHETYLGMKNNG